MLVTAATVGAVRVRVALIGDVATDATVGGSKVIGADVLIANPLLSEPVR